MNIFDMESYGLNDIQQLIDNDIEEDLHIDYKDGRALSKDDKKKVEITKDVSAFANSDGGIIIYGLTEIDHRPTELSPVDGRTFTKEWLEQVIQKVHRRIKDVLIFPIRIEDNLSKTIYVVKIPKSNDCPHMADDHKYYKRFNFSSVPMEEYEVRESFNRKQSPTLQTIGAELYIDSENQENEKVKCHFLAYIRNDSNNIGEYFKLNAIFHGNKDKCHFSYQPYETKISYTNIDEERWKISIHSQEMIYPHEAISIGHLDINIDKDYADEFISNTIIELYLYYQGGQDTSVYIPHSGETIYDSEEIKKLIGDDIIY